MPSAWICLTLAGLLEIVWAIGLKYTEGFSRVIPSLITVAAMGASFALLSIAIKTLPVGTAYAVWVGIGAVGTAALGVVLFQEPLNLARVGCLTLIIAGILGLKFLHVDG